MKLQSINPHDQSVVGEVEFSSSENVHQAVQSAKKAFKSWKVIPIKERVTYVKKFRNLVEKHQKELARLVTLEMGKPLQQSLEDIPWEIGYLNYYIDKAGENLADEEVFKEKSETYRVSFEPYGVCACIAPWNFPLAMFDSGVIPALLAGNTVVFKPSEYTTLSQKLSAELLLQSGLSEGVLNVIYGAGEVGKQLIDEDIDLAWFTGSTKVGKDIYAKCGQKFIKCLTEMGGSSAGIVFADADLKLTLDQLYWARFLNCGQVCSAVKRLFIERSAYDDILKKYIDRLKKVKIGNPLDNPDIGPLVNQKQLANLEIQVKDAVEKGAKVEIGGKRPADSSLANGNYFEPTVLTNVNFDMKVMNEEVFGPVLPVMPFDSIEEVIELANRSEYGLSAEVYTTDISKGNQIARSLESGVVAINTDGYYKPACPIGGYKNSGIGREYGKIGMQEFAQVKLIAINNPT